MKINKKFIIISITIMLVIIFYLIYSKKGSDNENINITPPKPSIKTDLVGSIKIDDTFDKSKYIFPEKMPTLTIVKRSLDKSFVENIKNKLGISEDIQEFKDLYEGTKFFVNSQSKYLIVTPKTSIVKFGLSTTDFTGVNDRGYSDDEFVGIARKIVVDTGLYNLDQISFLNVQYLRRNFSSEGLEKSNRDEAEIFSVSFTYASNQYEIANNYTVKAPIYLELLKNGEVFSSEITLIENIKSGITDYPIKNYQEFINSLNQSKIVSLDGDYYSVSDIKSVDQLENLKVDNVKIAYFDEGKKDGYLQPIFVIEATVNIEDSSTNKAILYLPAYK